MSTRLYLLLSVKVGLLTGTRKTLSIDIKYNQSVVRKGKVFHRRFSDKAAIWVTEY